MSVAKTSRIAYKEVKKTSEPTQSERIFKIIKRLGGKATINQIKAHINIPPGRISARLGDLISRDKIEVTKEKIKHKGRPNQIYKILN